MRKVIIGALCVGFLGLTSVEALAQNQLPGHQTSAPLPPALMAAINSGNAESIKAAILVLAAGNPERAGTLAIQVATVAEARIALNPAQAAAIASAANDIASSPAVINAAPQLALNIAVISERIAVNPAVQVAAPSTVAQLSASSVRIATSEQVYALSPTAALQVMSDAYNTASSPAINAANPGALEAITKMLVTASADPKLASALAETGAAITAILTKQELPTDLKQMVQIRGTAS